VPSRLDGVTRAGRGKLEPVARRLRLKQCRQAGAFVEADSDHGGAGRHPSRVVRLRGVIAVPTPTVTPTSTATVTASPGATASPPTGAERLSGNADVDAVLSAVTSKDVSALLSRTVLQEMACIDPKTQGLGGPVRCGPGQVVGTLVKAFPEATCEGEWTLEQSLREMFTQWLDGADLSRGVYGVVRGPALPRSEPYWPVGEYWLVYSTKAPATGPGGAGQAKVILIEGGRIVGLRFGCSETPAQAMTNRGNPLPVLVPALATP